MIVNCISDKRSQKSNCVAQFLELVEKIPLNENGCKVWPLGISNTGYGVYSIKNFTYSVSRLLHNTLKESFTEDGLVVRHKCDNRECCNIDHLEIGTQKDNIQDASKRKRLRLGENNNMSSLTEEKIMYCRNSYPGKSTWELSKELGIDHGNIAKAISGKSWKHLPGEKKIITDNSAKGIKHFKAKLTDEIVLKIISEYPSKTGTQLANEYRVSHANIYVILNKKIWKHLWL